MKLFIKCRCIAMFALGLISFYSEADWKMPREALDRRLVQAEFRIHYTLSGENAFPVDVSPLQRAQQASEQLSKLVSQIDQANRFYRDQLGLTSPLGSARYRDTRSIDVHIIKLKDGKMGATGDASIIYHYKHFAGASPALTIALSNQWHPANLTPNHEVFHAYQYAYTFFKNPWYLEGMAHSIESAFKKGDVHTQTLPSDRGQLEQVLRRSYGADLFWNRLMYLCDSVCGDSSTPVKVSNGGVYKFSGHFCGGELVRSTLEQFQTVEIEAAHARGIDPNNWPENEQRSDKNNSFLLRGLRRAIESQCQVRSNPELEAFHKLLEEY